MSQFKYLSQKDEILSLYNSGKTYVEIAKIIDPNSLYENSAQNIRRLVIKYGIPRERKSCLLCKVDFILQAINTGKSLKEISDILCVPISTLASFIHRKFPNIKFLPEQGNVDYFHTINSYAKAYIVGFIAADGCLVKTKSGSSHTLTITVKEEDGDVLNFIKSEIGNSHSLLHIERPSKYNPNKIIHHIRYSITNRNITTDLYALGITSNKSLTMPDIIGNIPYEYRDAFIIGYFDGDGSVTIRDGLFSKPSKKRVYPDNTIYISFKGTVPFLTGICRHLGISTSHIHQYCSIATLAFASKKDVMRLFQCYKNLPFYYKRKHEKFLKRINHPSFDKYR